MNPIPQFQRVLPLVLSRQAVLVPRTTLLLRQAIVSATCSARCYSSTKEQVPKEDYYNGHLLVDHLEYIDDMLDHTLKIENTVKGLKSTHDKKYQAYMKTASPGATAELDDLFHQSAMEKEELMKQLEELKKMMMMRAQTMYYAVDAPDGMPDAELVDEEVEVDRIIDYASKFEDAKEVKRQHEMEKAIKKERARDPEHDW